MKQNKKKPKIKKEIPSISSHTIHPYTRETSTYVSFFKTKRFFQDILRAIQKHTNRIKAELIVYMFMNVTIRTQIESNWWIIKEQIFRLNAKINYCRNEIAYCILKRNQRTQIEAYFGWSAVLISFYVPCNKNSVGKCNEHDKNTDILYKWEVPGMWLVQNGKNWCNKQTNKQKSENKSRPSIHHQNIRLFDKFNAERPVQYIFIDFWLYFVFPIVFFYLLLLKIAAAVRCWYIWK